MLILLALPCAPSAAAGPARSATSLGQVPQPARTASATLRSARLDSRSQTASARPSTRPRTVRRPSQPALWSVQLTTFFSCSGQLRAHRHCVHVCSAGRHRHLQKLAVRDHELPRRLHAHVRCVKPFPSRSRALSDGFADSLSIVSQVYASSRTRVRRLASPRRTSPRTLSSRPRSFALRQTSRPALSSAPRALPLPLLLVSSC